MRVCKITAKKQNEGENEKRQHVEKNELNTDVVK